MQNETSKVKRPSFQFYPGDWLNDAALRMVSVPARGLWIEMICLMHQGSDYGYLKVNHKVILPANLARMAGATLQEVEGWLQELEDAGVFSRDEDGCTFSKRMIRDERVRSARAAGGKLGGNPNLKPAEPKDNLPPNLGPTPSSSSSSSSSKSKPKPSSSAGAADDDEGAPAKVKPFDQFWAVYPRKVGKIDAQKAWTKLKLDSQVAEIVAAVLAQLEGHDFKRDDGQFIPHPATWLRAGRWLDEVRPWTPPPPKLPAGWWADPELMKQAGLMLDPPLKPLPNEGQKAFAHRIRVATGQADEAPPQASMAPPIAAPYIPPAPPDGVVLTEEQRQARRDEMREQLAKMKQAGNLAAAGVQQAAA